MVSVPGSSFVHSLSEPAPSLQALLELQAAGHASDKLASSNTLGAMSAWSDAADQKLYSLFANTTAAMSSTEHESSDLGAYPASSPVSALPSPVSALPQLVQGLNQWSAPSREPSQAAVLAALQSIQLKLQVQEQAVEFQTMEKQNQLLISGLLSAQQRIQELQSEVTLLQHAIEKMEATNRFTEQEQRIREQVLQQRHAQLTASNMEAELAIQQMEESLLDVRKRHKELNYSNIVLALGYPSGSVPVTVDAPTLEVAGNIADVGAAGMPTGPEVQPTDALSAMTGDSSAASGSRTGVASYANRKCYNCGQKGHRAGDCPNPRTRPDTSGDSPTSPEKAAAGSATESPIFPESPAKVSEALLFAPPTPDAGLSSVAASRNGGTRGTIAVPPAAPLAQPIGPTVNSEPKRTPQKLAGAGSKPPTATEAKAVDIKCTPTKRAGRAEGKPRPHLVLPSTAASPRIYHSGIVMGHGQGFITPPMTPDAAWKAVVGCSALGPMTPTTLGSLTPATLGPLTPSGLGPLTPSGLGPLTPNALGHLTPNALGPLTPTPLGPLAPTPMGAGYSRPPVSRPPVARCIPWQG